MNYTFCYRISGNVIHESDIQKKLVFISKNESDIQKKKPWKALENFKMLPVYFG